MVKDRPSICKSVQRAIWVCRIKLWTLGVIQEFIDDQERLGEMSYGSTYKIDLVVEERDVVVVMLVVVLVTLVLVVILRSC